MKVFLIILAVFVLLILVAGIVGLHWIHSHAGELKAEGMKIRAEAAAFGRDKDPNACVDETFARLSRCDDFVCEAKIRVFLTGCVAASNKPAGFCASIPRRDQYIDSAKWVLAECERRGRPNDQRCARVIAGLQEACERR